MKRKAGIYTVLIILLGSALFIQDLVPFTSYFDELVELIAFIVIFTRSINKRIDKRQLNIYLCLLSVELIGFISTLLSMLVTSKYAIVMDMFLFPKPYLIFLLFYGLSDHDKNKVISNLVVLAKCMLIITFICAILSQFVDISMTAKTEEVLFFNLNVFGFTYKNTIQTVWLVVSCYSIICYVETNRAKLNCYTAIYFITLFLMWSGFSSVLIICSIVLFYLFRRNRNFKLHIWQIFPAALVMIVFSYSDISEYLLNSAAPRAVLIKYGVVTANSYFPVGSGFASYGSEMAARYYSPLYYLYGFNDITTLSYKASLGQTFMNTLKDGYINMIMGQFGWIGFLLFLFMLYNIFMIVYHSCVEGRKKAISLSIIITVFVTMLVSSNVTTGNGILVMAVLGLLCRRSNTFGYQHTFDKAYN